MHEAVRHEIYKKHNIRSSPVEIDKTTYKVRLDITLPPIDGTTSMCEHFEKDHRYPTLDAAHAAGLEYGRSLIDKGIVLHKS